MKLANLFSPTRIPFFSFAFNSFYQFVLEEHEIIVNEPHTCAINLQKKPRLITASHARTRWRCSGASNSIVQHNLKSFSIAFSVLQFPSLQVHAIIRATQIYDANYAMRLTIKPNAKKVNHSRITFNGTRLFNSYRWAGWMDFVCCETSSENGLAAEASVSLPPPGPWMTERTTENEINITENHLLKLIV